MSFEMMKTERIDGLYLSEYFHTKLTYNPLRLYSKKIEVNKNPELLYRHGENDNHAIVNPDGFPWINLKLDPKGFLMRRNQHHTLYETGYQYALCILQFLFDKYGDEIPKMSTLHHDEMVNDRLCYVIEFNNPHFGFHSYAVKEGENVLDIALRNLVSEYMIVEINKDVDDYVDIEKGQIITIPIDYCSRMIISIDKEKMIPLSVKVYDEKGLYEQYEYKNVQINPIIKEEEFSLSNPDYGF